MLGRTMHGIDYDEIHDEIVVPQQFGQAILVFKGAAAGEERPIRVIQGSKTMLTALDRLAVDAVNNEIYVPEGDRVLVFDLLANGNVAPKRVLGGPDTGFTAAGAVAIDPTRNLIVVGAEARSADGRGLPELADLRSHGGGQRQAEAGDHRREVAAERHRQHADLSGGRAGLHDPADRLRRRVEHRRQRRRAAALHGRRPERPARQKPRGLDLDPKHNAVIVSDKQLNAVLTYEMPSCSSRSRRRRRAEERDHFPFDRGAALVAAALFSAEARRRAETHRVFLATSRSVGTALRAVRGERTRARISRAAFPDSSSRAFSPPPRRPCGRRPTRLHGTSGTGRVIVTYGCSRPGRPADSIAR